MSERDAALRRRRWTRLAGCVVALGIVASLGLFGGRQVTRARPKPSPAPEVRLPQGCTVERRQPARPKPPPQPPQFPSVPDGTRAVVRTSCGPLVVDLLPERAPVNVGNFVWLARHGFYDGLQWHRIENDFVVQSGDPNDHNADPPDGPGYHVADELTGIRGRDYVYGVVAMANRGPDTAGSQFFIVVHDYVGASGEAELERPVEPAGLQPDYTIIGRVERTSWTNLKHLAAVRTRGGLDLVAATEPIVPVYIDSIEIRTPPSG